MRNKVIGIVISFIMLLTVVFICILNIDGIKNKERNIRNTIVELNEIEKIAELSIEDEAELGKLSGEINNLQENLRDIDVNRSYIYHICIFYLICISFLIIVYLYTYMKIIRPFIRLKKFAAQVAQGNLDIPLYMEKKNLFGDFTWSFDMMREELKRAKDAEEQAIKNNKLVIATISHDIKTPIASIRAYTEALQENMDSNSERRERYISVIIRKCDEVTKLTNDLFLHSLSELEKIQILVGNYKAQKIIGEILEELDVGSVIKVNTEIPKCSIAVDKRRLAQVFENIISNSLKYSDGKNIFLEFKLENEYLNCYISDFGPGILDEDMPFVFEKFYRGKNIGNKDGSGLGLYIVQYIMKTMGGEVVLKNRKNGLTVLLKIKTCKET